MAAMTASKVSDQYKTKYRVRNWSEYDRALAKRGDITVWFRHTRCNRQAALAEANACGIVPDAVFERFPGATSARPPDPAVAAES